MTKLKTIITALLIGTSSMATVAAAQPSSTVYEVGARDHRTYDNYGINVDARFDARFGWNDGREIDPGYYRRLPPQRIVTPTPGIACAPDGRPWAALTASIPAAGDHQVTRLGGVSVGALRLAMERGSAYVTHIDVQFTDGGESRTFVNRTIVAGETANIVALGGLRDVKRVAVYTADGRGAMYRLIGA